MDNDNIDVCEYCFKNVCNGMGSAEMPMTTAILNALPMAKIFARSFKIHDMDHHKQIGFEESNSRLIRHMKAELKTIEFKGWAWVRSTKRTWYRYIITKVHWFISGEKGLEAYNKGACLNLPIHLT